MTSTDKSSSSSSKLSTTERNCTTVPAPPPKRLTVEDLFSNPRLKNSKPNLDKLKEHIILEGCLTEEAALRIIETGKQKTKPLDYYQLCC